MMSANLTPTVLPTLTPAKPTLRFAALSVFALIAAHPAAGFAATLRVGAGMMYTTVPLAAAAAQDGDTIELVDPVFRGDAAIAVFRANNLTIRGPAAHTTLDVSGTVIGNQKGIFVIQGANTTVENVDFVGARVPDRNGAGIRQEGAGLTVRGCVFRDNQNGILAGDNAASDIVIEGSGFVANGVNGGGLAHNLYINHVRSLTMRGCYSTGVREGHMLKSRAFRSVILGSRFTLEGGDGSAEMDFPEGGVIYVIGNVVQQSATSPNHAILWVGTEGRNPNQSVHFVNNTLINDYMGSAQWFRLGAGFTVNSINNLFVGTADIPAGVMQRGSVMTTTGFVDRAMFDFRLVAGSAAIDQGVDPGMDGMMALSPTLSYQHPMSTVARQSVGTIDVGAYEFGAPASVDVVVPPMDATIADVGMVPRDEIPLANDAPSALRDNGVVVGDVPTGAMMNAGCGCRTQRASNTGALSAFALLGLWTLGRRRDRRQPPAK